MKPAKPKQELVREKRGEDMYEYFPLGKYIVAAPKVCRGRPTFKYTRIQVAFVLDLLAEGWTVDRVTREYKASNITAPAVREAINLAKKAFVQASPVLQPAA
jgi:uncharacterized protein (DUF433 family)